MQAYKYNLYTNLENLKILDCEWDNKKYVFI